MAVAFLFPGQGSAAVGMGAELAAREPVVDEYFRRVSDLAGRDLRRLALEGPEETLIATQYAQPAIFALSAACLDLFKKRSGVDGSFFAGHSLGEYTALYAASSLSFDDAAALVVQRGRFIANACETNPGTMGAVLGLDDAAVERICEEASAAGTVVAANFNTPGQVVVSGTNEGVAKAGEVAVSRGGRFSLLKVSGAFHSPLVAAAAEDMKIPLAQAAINPPKGVFAANATGAAVNEPERIRELLYQQIASPVRWGATLALMLSGGVDAAVEFGHGRVLAGMVKKVQRDFPVYNVFDIATLETAAEKCR